MTTPHVSLVIPSRGGAQRLPILFEALSRQTRSDWEAIVVLDGDIDGSEAVVAEAAAELPVRAVVFPENRGRSAALNAGFESAQGEILVRCDDDLVPSPDYVARHAEAHQGRDVGVVGLYLNNYPETTYARVYGRDWDERFRRDAYAVSDEQAWQYWAGNCSVTRQRWRDVGPYDTGYRAYGWEDVDWGYRLAALGVPIVIDPALETEHRIAATTTAIRAQRAFYSGAARNRFDEKHSIIRKSSSDRSAWNRAVGALAKRLDEERIPRLGRAVDAMARVAPRPAAQKLVALVVEASAQSGSIHGQTSGAV